MTVIDDLPLDRQFAHGVSTLAEVNEGWTVLEFLASATISRVKKGHASAIPTSESSQPADEAISTFAVVTSSLYKAALFSQNESIDEIATRHLKYLLVPYLSAVALQTWQGPANLRLRKLEQSKQELQTFFTSMDGFGLLTELERDRVLNDTPDAVMSPSQKRDEQVARFKAEKAAGKRLEALVERLKNRNAEEDDEEGERDATLVVVQSAVRRALDLNGSLDQEIEILRYAERQRSKGRDPRVVAEKARPKGPPPGLGGMPPSFRIVNEKEAEREKVFRPSHSLPTYTVEEWGEIEAKRMMQAEKEKQEKEIVAKRRKDEEDSDGDEVVDRETMEARGWDDWKDEHNKGSGNTIR